MVPYEGTRLGELDDAQRELAVALVGLYTGNLRDGHAEVRLSEVERHWDDTYFAWIGDAGPDAVFYYRIHSPVIMIEYDHLGPVALDGPRGPSRNHSAYGGADAQRERLREGPASGSTCLSIRIEGWGSAHQLLPSRDSSTPGNQASSGRFMWSYPSMTSTSQPAASSLFRFAMIGSAMGSSSPNPGTPTSSDPT